jgi:hypothetical protein
MPETPNETPQPNLIRRRSGVSGVTVFRVGRNARHGTLVVTEVYITFGRFRRFGRFC